MSGEGQRVFTMVLPGGDVIERAVTEEDDRHLVSVLETGNDGWYVFQVFGAPNWAFFSCEVTNL